MRHLLLVALFLFPAFFTTGTALAEEKKTSSKMCVIATDKTGKEVEGVLVDIVCAGEKKSYTTDKSGKSCIEVAAPLIESITITKDDCQERLAPVGVLDGLKVIITLHCWPK